MNHAARQVSVKLLTSLVPEAGVEPARPLGIGELTVKILARGRHPVSEILERSGEGEEGVSGRLLLLEGRTAAAAGRPTVGWDGGNPNGVGRVRVRVLHDLCGHAPESAHAEVRCLLARGSRGNDHPRRT